MKFLIFNQTGEVLLWIYSKYKRKLIHKNKRNNVKSYQNYKKMFALIVSSKV